MTIRKNKTYILITALLLSRICFAQTDSIAKQRERASADSAVNALMNRDETPQKIFAVSSDFLLDLWCERNIGVEFQISNYVAIGGSFSVMQPNTLFKVNILAASPQWNWPGLIYDGFGERLYVKYYPRNKNKRSDHWVYSSPKKYCGYWALQIDMKQMSYNNHLFDDTYSGEQDVYTVASATQNVFDVALFHGNEFMASRYFTCDVFYGIGERQRRVTDNITYTSGSQPIQPYPTGQNSWEPTGIFKSVHYLPFPEIGLGLGFTLPHTLK